MIKGIKKSIESDATGAVAAFHKIEYYAADLRAKHVTLVINGYVSEDACNNQKQALVSTNVTLQALPGEADNVLDFFYQAVTRPTAEPTPDPNNPMLAMPQPSNVFAGAELIQDPPPKK